MPQGCATWPALWESDDTVGIYGGEVDIVEGVNDVEPNSCTLHTAGNCTMPANRTELGYVCSSIIHIDSSESPPTDLIRG